MPFRSFLLLVLICLVWALNVVVTRLVVGDMAVPAIAYAFMRAVVMGVVLARWLFPIPQGIGRILVVTFMVSGGSFGLFFIGLQDATPSAAAVVNLTGAPLTVLFAIVILNERIGWRRAMGIALTFAGVLVAVASPGGWQSSTGLAFVAASTIVGALGAVWLKRIELSATRLQAWAAAGSMIGLLPLTLLFEEGQVAAVMTAGLPFVAALAFSALVVSVLAHTAYFHLIQRHDANLIAPLTLMTPIFTIALGALVTRDPIGLMLILGAAIAGSGVLVILLRPSRAMFKGLLVRPRL